MKKIIFIIGVFISLNSCISKKAYSKLNMKIDTLERKNNQSDIEIIKLYKRQHELVNDIALLNNKLRESKSEVNSYSKLHKEFKISREKDLKTINSLNKIKTQYSNLNESYGTLNYRYNSLLKQKNRVDTVLINNKSKKFEEGLLTFYCPEEMTEEVVSNVYAIIGNSELKNKLNTRILKIINKNLDKDEDSIFSKNLKNEIIELKDKMKIELIHDSTDFHTPKLVKGKVIQKINSKNGTDWFWQVKPKKGTAKRKLTLTFKVTMIDDFGKEYIKDPVLFRVNIRVQQSYIERLQLVIWDQPLWPITFILIPVITFFAGIWKEKRTNKVKAS